MSNEQEFQRILNSKARNICVVAGPGSGKTSCILVPKAQQIVDDPQVDPETVLLLTFPRLSALDLQKKVKSLDRMPRACTVHSFCLSFLLSENDHDIRERIDSILLDFEKEVLVSDLKLTFSERSLSNGYPQKDKRVLGRMLDEFSAGWATQPHDKVFDETEEKRLFKWGVLNWLSEYKAAIMDEIVYYAVDLANKVTHSRFIDEPQYILVDEFQDLNRLEQEFIEMLASNSRLLIVVGDPDQSIYSFKFAHPVGLSQFTQKHKATMYTLPYTGRCPRKVVRVANQLLQQSNSQRGNLLKTLPNASEGETHFIRKRAQLEEFGHVLKSIAGRVNASTKPKDIVVLVPRRKLGSEFVSYANGEKSKYNALQDVDLLFVNKPKFGDSEQGKVLLFSLVANPNSLLHARCYLGVGDSDHYAEEIRDIKDTYEGSLATAMQRASPSDFSKRKKRICRICEKIEELRLFINAHSNNGSLDQLIDELFPIDDTSLSDIRKILLSLRESEDNAKTLYSKFVDYIRTVPHSDNTVRVMTIMLSKGLEVDHVYIMGCNDGNIPGRNRSNYLSDHEYKEEQRRLLYVGFTRAKKSLTVSWSRFIPFGEARANYTEILGTYTINGEKHAKVGLSEFLQDLSGIYWE